MNSLDLSNKLYKRKANEINLKELYTLIKRRFWIIVVLTLIMTSLGAYYSYSSYAPIYQTSSRIIISTNPDYRSTLQVIIKDSTVLEKVVKSLGLQTSPEALAGQITVQSIENSQVVSIGVTDSDPKRAAEIANTTAKVFKDEIPNIVGFNKVTFLSAAKINPWPINQNQNRTTIIASIIGLVLGIGLVFLLDSLDDTIRVESDIEEILGLPVLGRVSKTKKKNLKKKMLKQFNSRGGTNGFK